VSSVSSLGKREGKTKQDKREGAACVHGVAPRKGTEIVG